MPKQRIKDQRRSQLIKATIDSIARRGLNETTITHICQGANLSRGIVNFYFESKEQLMRQVLASLLEDYQTVWQQARDKAPEDKAARLEAIIRAHFDRRICASKRLNVLSAFWGHAASHEPYRLQFEASDQAVIGALAACMKRAQAQQMAEQCFALIRGLWLKFLLAPRQQDRAVLAEEALFFVRLQSAPLKVVAENPEVTKKAKSQKPKAPAAQMDIEDLFANG